MYLGNGKPDPLPYFAAMDTKEPVKIIGASMNAKVQPGADRSEVKTKGISVENTEAAPSAETATETKTVDNSKVTTEAEGTPTESDSNVDVDSETTVTSPPTVDAMDTDELMRVQTSRAKSKKPIPLWDRLTRTPLQSKRAAQVEREQKVDAGPAGGSLDLTMTLGSQPQSDLYLDITPKVVNMLI